MLSFNDIFLLLFFLLRNIKNKWCKVNKYIYLSTALKYNFNCFYQSRGFQLNQGPLSHHLITNFHLVYWGLFGYQLSIIQGPPGTSQGPEPLVDNHLFPVFPILLHLIGKYYTNIVLHLFQNQLLVTFSFRYKIGYFILKHTFTTLALFYAGYSI